MTYTDIASQVTRLPLNERLMLLETLTRSVRRELRQGTTGARSVAGKAVLNLAGTISAEDAQAMHEAIELGCEQVDERDW
jgi:hypothetical protein